jgi:hypothetical protein
MQSPALLTLTVFLVVCSCSAASPPPPEPERPAVDEAARVQEDVRAVLNAVYGGDLETMLRYTHPAILTGMGGEAQARAALEQSLRAVAEGGMKLISLTFPEAPRFMQGTERRFAIVPTLSVVEAGGQRVESLNYQLGVLERGSEAWTYVEGSRINKDNVGVLFPDFPADYAFPTTYRKRL